MSNPLDLFIGKEFIHKTEVGVDVVLVIKSIYYGNKIIKTWSGNEEYTIPILIVTTTTDKKLEFKKLTDIKLNQPEPKKIITEVECYSCGTKLSPTFNFQQSVHTPLSNIPWDNGTVNDLSIGYGSKFDLQTISICLCDKCIEKGLKENKLTKVATRQRDYNY